MRLILKIFVLVVAVVAVLFCIVLNSELRRKTAEVDGLALALSMGDTECALKVAAKEDVIRKLTAERDALRVELKAAALALGVEEAEESVELTVFREKLAEVEKRLVKAKEDRDNLANELADCRAESRALTDEFLKVLDANGRLESLVEAKEHALAALQTDLKCCQEELARRPNCCTCHQKHENHRAEPKPKVKHRRHP